MREYRAEGGLLEQANHRIAQLEQENESEQEALRLAVLEINELKQQLAEARAVVYQTLLAIERFMADSTQYNELIKFTVMGRNWLAANPEGTDE